jgi:membrane-associated phospholipid phosphatase
MVTPPSPRVPAALAVGCALAFVGLALALPEAGPWLVEQQPQQVGQVLREAAPWLVDTARLLAVLGSTVVVLLLVAVVATVLLARRRPRWATWLLACALGGFALTHLVKRLVGRDRPLGGVDVPLDAAFPSGHTTAGIYGWVTVGVVALCLLPRGWHRLGYVAIMVGLLMSPSRLVLGVHWLGDVLAGLLLASAWVLGVTAVVLASAQRVPPSAVGSVASWPATGPPDRE